MLLNKPDSSIWGKSISNSYGISRGGKSAYASIEGDTAEKDTAEGNIWNLLFSKKLLIAFSGGKDSLALLHYLKVHEAEFRWKVVASHVNHQLRGDEAARDQTFCEEWCRNQGIELEISTVDVSAVAKQQGRGFEHSARDVRYRLFEEQAQRLGCDLILTGHTLDDQLESFFVDLYTGASIYTIGGVRDIVEHADRGVNRSGSAHVRTPIVRPFLTVSTDAVNEYLDRYNIVPMFDSTNADSSYTRNMIRNELLPFLDHHKDVAYKNTVARLQLEARALSNWLDKYTESALKVVGSYDSVIIDRSIFDTFDDVPKRYLLGKVLSMVSRGGKVHSEEVMSRLGEQKNQKSIRLSMPNGTLCEITPRFIQLFPRHYVSDFEVTKDEGCAEVLLPNGRRVEFARDLISKKVVIRNRRDGDKVSINSGLVATKKLFYNNKIELYDRDRAVTIVVDNEIIWVEHIYSGDGYGPLVSIVDEIK